MKIFFLIDINIFAVLALIVVAYYLRKKLPGQTLIVRSLNLISTILIIGLVSEILSKCLLDDNGVLTKFRYILSVMLILIPKFTQSLIPFLWCIFLLAYTQKEKRSYDKLIILLTIPIIIESIIILSIPFTGWLYSILEEPFVLLKAPYVNVVILISVFYMLFALMHLVINRKTMSQKEILVLISFSILPLIGFLFQILSENLIYTQAFFSISVILTYVYLQENMIRYHSVTNAWNRKSFDTFMDYKFKRKEIDYSISYMTITNYDYVLLTNGEHKAMDLLHDFSKLILNILPNTSHLVYMENGEFIIYFATKNEKILTGYMKQIEDLVKKYNMNSYSKIKFTHYEATFNNEFFRTNARLIRYAQEQNYKKYMKEKVK